MPTRRTILAASVALAGVPRATAMATGASSMEEGFASPPEAARPRVWWHWMNGNITREGIAQDLAWMRRVGVGGVQNFDAALATPQVVDRRLTYMTPEWKSAFGFAVRRAAEYDFEFAIAASPGWSETGGPWVEARDGMKKLVWSETDIEHNAPFSDVLAHPPTVSGPFQGMATQGTFGLMTPGVHAPEFYDDVAVLAFPLVADMRPLRPTRAVANGEVIDPTLLNSDHTTGIAFPEGDAQTPGYVRLDFSAPRVVRSATFAGLYVNDAPFAPPVAVFLDVSRDGQNWRTIVRADIGQTPTTLSFAPVRGRHFRVRFERLDIDLGPILGMSPGVSASALIDSFADGMAVPTARLVQFELFTSAHINEFEKKAAFAMTTDYLALDGQVGEEAVPGIDPRRVEDVTHLVDEEGRLHWTPRHGRWRILRLGYSLTGKKNHPAPAEATGLEVDKYDADAVERYLNTYLDMYETAAGAMERGGVQALLTDSTEVGAANWTPRMLEHFQRLRGYDAKPWLPAMTGLVVGSRAQSEAFLFDVRTTLGELHASEHYQTIARVAHQRGMIVYGESLEGGRSAFGDDLDMRAYADIPMSAMWSFSEAPRSSQVADGRGAASVAHIKGRAFVACEALTSIGQPWNHSPRDLQPMIDAIFLTGVNRPVIHTSAHQPGDRGPGVSLNIFGQYFTRLDTWAEMAKPWVDYISRSSFMLQQGRNVADVAYFYGEDTPIGAQASVAYPTDVPHRYGYDFISAALLDELSVEAGELVSAGGARYKLIYISQPSARMTLRTLRKLARLVEAGAVVVGEPPQTLPGLGEDSAAFTDLVARMWRGGAQTTFGSGRVLAGRDVEGALGRVGASPDFDCEGVSEGDVQFVHRAVSDGDVYFVANRTSGRITREARFRTSGKAAQVWRADIGSAAPASYRIEGAHTFVPLDLNPHESVFVVFRERAAAPARILPQPQLSQVGTVDGPWAVSFQADRGAPSRVTLAELSSLSDHSDPGVKYFSGVSRYTTHFELSSRPGEGPLWLDLGAVGDVAEVRLNGRFAGTVWKSPNRLDIARFARVGRNRIEVRVANLWTNRLIGDAQPGADPIAFTTTPTFTASTPLRPSGLVGPVTLWRAQS